MRNTLPPIREHAAAPKQRLQHEYDAHKKPCVQLRYLLAGQQAQTCQDMACLLGSGHIIDRSLVVSAAENLDALLDAYAPAGKPVSSAPGVSASLEHALRFPESFASRSGL
jgi:hypothetical protein